jgi:hypothetical protein
MTRQDVFVYITLGHRGTIRRHALCVTENSEGLCVKEVTIE